MCSPFDNDERDPALPKALAEANIDLMVERLTESPERHVIRLPKSSPIRYKLEQWLADGNGRKDWE